MLGAAAVVTMGYGLASAQATEPIDISPEEGPPGTPITVSGGGCTGAADVSVTIRLLDGADQLAETAGLVPDPEGDWSGTLTVPNDDSLAGKDLTVAAACLGGTVTYSSTFFAVEGSSGTTSSTSTTSSTTPAQPGGPGGPSEPSGPATPQPAGQTGQQPSRATPATPVRGDPNFTG